MKVCPSCGEQNPDKAKFCSECATPLAEAAPQQEERKVVTVLFADLVGFTSRSEAMDVEDVRGTLQPYHQLLRRELERFGGTVEKFIGDAVMALFGAPVAHEDDPERAVRAALAIQEAVAGLRDEGDGLDLHVRIGVNTGEALIALGARPSEGEGMASGDVVNTAARLESAARVDGVLVGEVTYRATNRVIEYEESDPIQAKGKGEPVRAWVARRVVSRFGSDVRLGASTPLVGRDAEMALVWSALVRARRESSPQLVSVVGVPGMGKSRLVWEVFCRVDGEEELVAWRQGRCLPYGEGVTFWALGEVVKAQAGILESDSPEQATHKLAATVRGLLGEGRDAEWVSSHLSALIGMGGESESGLGDRRGEAFSAWRRFVEAVSAQHPLVVVFEDLHWADEALLDFIDYLAEWAGGVPLFILCSARPELLERRPGWGGGKENSMVVSLAPLSDADTARLLSVLLDQVALPVETQSALLAHAEGNPLYAEEYVRMLIERGDLAQRGSVWYLTDPDNLPLPESVQGIIAARLDALTSEEKAVLQAAAMVGKVFWQGAVAAIRGCSQWELEDPLHRLERKHFVRRERQSAVADDTEYAFRHILVRDVAYGQLPRSSRIDAHVRAGEWIESLSEGRDDKAETIAHHYTTALTVAEATGAATQELRDKARHALAMSAYQPAVRHYQAALALWPEDTEPADRAIALFRLGKARFESEPDLPAELSQAVEPLTETGAVEAAAEALTMIGVRLANVYNQYPEFMTHCERAVALLRDRPPSGEKAFVLGTLASGHLINRSPNTDAAIALAQQSLAIAGQLPPQEATEIQHNAEMWIGASLVRQDDPKGLEHLKAALRLAESATSETGFVCLLNCSGWLDNLGERAQAIEIREQLRGRAQEFGAQFVLDALDGDDVSFRYEAGDWNAAEGAARQHVTSEQLMIAIPSHVVLAMIAHTRGDTATAESQSHVALVKAREHFDSEALDHCLATRARIMATIRPDEAAAACDELLSRRKTGFGSHPPLINLAWALTSLGRAEELLKTTEHVRLRSRTLRAAVAIAREDFPAAAALLTEMEMRPDEACARLEAGKQLIASGRRAEGEAELEKSLAFWRHVQAAPSIRECEALLARAQSA
jgi:class 3 adenylate cyclase/tetratricopeptide (TPR) repeat protein